ncbi:MAG: DeoR/GlpR family DNA-binding transcription regulator [Gammaproteobacteria bacterium]|jgi:DeoR/GlpR family transcriptional regulator of sugar metabolism|uniref:Transcriptional regulator, DeoR family n=1 Tax=Marinomonas polaris DSM 16579 TaxID=1122206 RepID=A0A1M4VG36_9GAMM|nr:MULTISPECIES: DeoR/GlpR family DNA-binding transcription regulator [Marinomonas]MBU1294495.1 DeoR/GlpR family DNA-binding transcription regulator [Gammaproteobacteria bacterium]MBU1465256.1 DeoR/GlpR family DNA-binding transcription regulator [Gammaproteobacteria bacterium]MBU2021550.1 DeoR/GlpR family DNA-binding transcription regulator [Gammaproteobacteria bacterium]MBU2238286.1 DeoR/GlpR family DNA-binding transcription regulator [Gammaproteobacteria bacterium]MBU2320883.1 DeoR/GlpR fami|tara:strand:+ start:58981 stop:59757 length:777 start_codon:yes stop_codon:yes gene_type:complete
MKRDERRQQIIDLLVENGVVDLEELAKRFAVSKMTIHRDLDELEAGGLLRKVRGGATIEAGMQFESDFRLRERQGSEGKELMALEALELVEPGMTVMVNDGSMAAMLGSMLPRKKPLTVITNNASILEALKFEKGIDLIALGGMYSSKFNGYFGVLAEQNLTSLRADLAFLSSPAVSGNQVFHMDADVIRVKKAMINAAVKTCLLVNHTRFDRVALHVLANLDDFDWVITDQVPEPNVQQQLVDAGIQLTIARPLENT